MVTAARKYSPLTGRNLEQNRALGGRPSALTGWVERERKRVGTQKSRTATTTTIDT